MAAQWFERRFIESESKTMVACCVCGRAMWLPPSKAALYKTCGPECADAKRASVKESRRRDCLTCGRSFIPRTTQLRDGGGKYCCVGCAEPTRQAGREPKAQITRSKTMRALHASGAIKVPKGADSPNWKGGIQAYLERRAAKDPVARAAARREYLKRIPERVREWSRRRGARKVGRLRSGCIREIGEQQLLLCAGCGKSISHGFHVDHIMPLALGGRHAEENIQLLCGRCNLRKSAKHPLVFLRELLDLGPRPYRGEFADFRFYAAIAIE